MKKNIYAIIDCDNFYVSCERLFRPDLNNKPVVVLSNNDGCVVSRSNEVKALGIEMGTPCFKISHIIEKHNIAVFSSNYPLYADISNRIMKSIEIFSPIIEIYSIDEAFLKLSMPIEKCTNYARDIRRHILENIGIPTTIGVAYTKTLTKVASKIAKKDKQYKGVLSLLNTQKNDKYLDMLKVQDIWGVGRQYSKWLNSKGIYTAKELKYANKKVVKKKMTIQGVRTVLELNNTECIPLDRKSLVKKSITSSKSFGKLTDSLEEVKQALAIDTTRACEKLRQQNSLTNTITVFLTTHPFKKPFYSNSKTVRLPNPVSDTSTLIKYSFTALEDIFKIGYKYKKTGVFFTNILASNNIQLDLYNPNYLKNLHKRENIMKAADKLNSTWGRDTVRVASMPKENRLKLKQENRSPRYTTNWNELPLATI